MLITILNKKASLTSITLFQVNLMVKTLLSELRKADKTLVKKINQAFQKLYKDGKFQEISNKWFGEDVATDAVKN